MIPTRGYAQHHSFTSLKPLEFEREDPKPNEIEIEVLFCGVCHSDIHQVKNDWGNTVYPCVPGHEIVGRVRSRGSEVERHQVGDLVGVGCMIDSCQACEPCREGEENYCAGPNSWLATYNGPMVPRAKAPDGRDNTYGGYSTSLVVREEFVLKIPAALDPEHAAPLLCAGVTTYSPLKHWGIERGDKVAIAGFGGLGHIAAQIAHAMGAHVTMLTTTPEKVSEIGLVHADEAVLLSDEDAVKAHQAAFDFILVTIPESFKTAPYISMLRRDGSMIVVGALDKLEFNNMNTAMHRQQVGGSLIGSLAETQEMLEFCAEHGVKPITQRIGIAEVNDAFEKVDGKDVRFRYVIDAASFREDAAGPWEKPLA